MRVLISALSCNANLGSEPSVGFHHAKAVASSHQAVIVASPPCEAPQGAALATCNAGPCLFNDIEASALLRFELSQLRLARQLHRQHHFQLVHRITPSATSHPTLLARLNLPLILGPVIGADPPPPSFEPFMRRPGVLDPGKDSIQKFTQKAR